MNRLRAALQLFFALMCAVAVLALARIAFGHSDAFWIMADPATAYCCGPDDCLPAYQDEIERTPEGWLHVPTATLLPFGGEHVHLNTYDAQVWRCVYAGALRCLFLPTGV